MTDLDTLIVYVVYIRRGGVMGKYWDMHALYRTEAAARREMDRLALRYPNLVLEVQPREVED